MPTDTAIPAPARLLKITEVATEVGLTARSIRYYEEIGLLNPAARSEGAYRLYDADDVARLRFIRGLRDDAGFSLAEIGRLLEDEEARTRNRDRFQSTSDPDERRGIVTDALARIDGQVEILRAKEARLRAMIEEAESRRHHLEQHLADLDAGREPGHAPPGASST
ncbi:MAG TPA: MerR family transcriptional regulator [Candidatus Limnocylindrales bacterium]|nr:MerR family transcriptional regulator [Candidatus Limnocylindrales bacterium]